MKDSWTVSTTHWPIRLLKAIYVVSVTVGNESGMYKATLALLGSEHIFCRALDHTEITLYSKSGYQPQFSEKKCNLEISFFVISKLIKTQSNFLGHTLWEDREIRISCNTRSRWRDCKSKDLWKNKTLSLYD